MNKTIQCLAIIIIVSFLLSLFLIPLTSAIGDYWTSMAPIPTARSGLGVAVVDGKVYAIGGRNDAISPYLDTNEMYDPATNTWTTKTPMPTPRRDFAIAVYKNKIYCIGGEFNDKSSMYFTGVNEVYDPATDTWETKASLPTPRFRMCANIVDGKIYVIGGAQYNVFPGISCSDKNEVYDPEADTWVEKTSIPVAVNRAASAVAGDRIFVLGGETGPFGSAGWHDFNQVYDAESDVWYTAAPVPVGFAAASAGATTGVYAPKRIYVFGGFTEASYTPRNLTQVYDPENNVWSIGVPMPNPQASFGVAVINDELYAIGERANFKYTPAGYGTSNSSIPSPSPSQEPTSTPETQQPDFALTWIIIVMVVSGSVASAGFLVYLKKIKKGR